MCVCMSVYLCVSVCVCVCVCVSVCVFCVLDVFWYLVWCGTEYEIGLREERGGERGRERKTDREREREGWGAGRQVSCLSPG